MLRPKVVSSDPHIDPAQRQTCWSAYLKIRHHPHPYLRTVVCNGGRVTKEIEVGVEELAMLLRTPAQRFMTVQWVRGRVGVTPCKGSWGTWQLPSSKPRLCEHIAVVYESDSGSNIAPENH